MPDIERRILGLSFDNAQFERGAAQSISTLGKLKDALMLNGADKGVTGIQNALNKISFNVLSNGLSNVTQGFSLLEQIGIGAARRLGASIEQIGEKLVSNLLTKQIMAGWGKYGEITQSIQTMVAATGKSVDYITERMNKLNWFTDETSFSLTDMTNNIAKFTSAGIDLDKAVNQMMGIGTAAAMAGSGVQNASHAMSGFSKAMSAGYMSTINWSWIQTAKLDTLAFKQTLIDAAVEVGTLKKVGDAYYTVAKGTKITAENMREGLSEKWLNTAAMEKALSVYGDFSNALSEFYTLVGDGSYYTTSELIEYINQFKEGKLEVSELNKIAKITGVSVDDLTEQFKSLSSETYDVGRKAFAAAQEAITLRQAWEALTDAVSTGWMKTFQLIFGNYEEAKQLWTNMANWLYELFAEGGNARNELLEEWHFTDSGGYNDLMEGLNNIMNSVVTLRDILKETFSNLLPPITVRTLTDITTKFKDFTDNLKGSLETFKDFNNNWASEETAESMSVMAKAISTITGSTRFHARERGEVSKTKYGLPGLAEVVAQTLYNDNVFTGVNTGRFHSRERGSYRGQSKYGIDKFIKSGQYSIFDQSTADSIIDNTDKITRRYENLWDILNGIKSTGIIIKNTVELAWGAIKTAFAPVKSLGDDILELFGAVGRRITKISQSLVGDGKLVRFFRDLGTDGSGWISNIVEGIRKLIQALTALIDPEVESSTSEFMRTVSEVFKGLWGGIKTIIETVAPLIGNLFRLLKELFGGLADAVHGFFGNIDWKNFDIKLKGLLDVGILGMIFSIFKKINDAAKKFKGKGIKEIIETLIGGEKTEDTKGVFAQIKDGLGSIGKTLGEFTTSVSTSIAKFTNTNLLKEFANSILKIAASMLIIALIPQDKFARATVTIAGLISTIVGMFYLFSKIDLKQAGAITAIGTAMAGIGTGILLISAALLVMALVPEDKLSKGLGVLIVTLSTLAVFIGVLSSFDGKRMLAAALTMIAVSASIDLITVALLALAFIPANRLLKAVGVLAVALTAITAAVGVLAKLTFFSSRLIGAAAAIFIVSMALDVIAVALIALAFVPAEKLVTGVLALVTVIAAISTALGVLGSGNTIGMLAAAAAMLVISPAILVFAAALAVLSILPFGGLVAGLVALGATLAMIVVAAYMITPVIPALLALAGSFVAISVSAALLTVEIVAISAAISVVVLAVAGGITMILGALTDLVYAIRGTVRDSSSEAEAGGADISTSLLDGLKNAFSESIGGVVTNLIDGLKEKISGAWERLKEIGRNLWSGLKNGLEAAAGIKSPSREMAKEMGYMIAGLDVGAERNQGRLKGIGSGLADALISSTSEGLSEFDSLSPYISPVLDMTNAAGGSLSFGATLTPSAVRSLGSVSADIRDQRESMNDYIDTAVQSAIEGMKDQLTFVVPLEVDGHQFAKSTAKFTRDAQNLLDRNTLRKGGYTS